MTRDIERHVDDPSILLIGTLDTKADEIAWTAGVIERLGGNPLILDSGVAGVPGLSHVDFPREEVASAAGVDLGSLAAMSRGDAVGLMAEGVKTIVEQLAVSDRIQGVLCIGGAGASLAYPAMQALAIGFPKLIVSPLASGVRHFGPFVGLKDVAVLHSVADIMGVNEITEPVFREAAGFIVGAARAAALGSASRNPDSARDRNPVVAVSMNGNTTPAVSGIRGILAAHEIELVAFHANGVGGQAMEQQIGRGVFDAVLDFTTTEISGHEVGGMMDAGPSRMEVAGAAGLPQVLVPGCIDLITTGPLDEAEIEFPGRPLYRHNPHLTLVRLTTDEMGSLGHVFARKANEALGPTVICLPSKGFSAPNHPGGPFWNPVADGAFIDAVRRDVQPQVTVEIVDAHINDAAFVEVTASRLLELMTQRSGLRSEVDR